jgi:hypothetical protein
MKLFWNKSMSDSNFACFPVVKSENQLIHSFPGNLELFWKSGAFSKTISGGLNSNFFVSVTKII